MLQHISLSLDDKLKRQNLGYYNQSIAKSQLDNFRKSLNNFTQNINILANDKLQREESVKLKIRDFLISTFYNNDQLDIHRNIDLAILNKEILTNKVDVIFELKTPQNNAEMISTNNLNKKAMWELVHYYMQERLKGNITIKHLIATNGLDWFVFDAREFEKLFYNNKAFYQKYTDWNNNTTVNNNVAMAYQIIEENINISNDTIEIVHFNINAINTEDEIIKLYKLLSPQHLLKLPFANDSNTLNTEFYNELLYILGLEEKNEGKYIINRATPANRQSASLLENTINQLKINKNITDENELFEIALELCITWLNRILFLKLLEGQLIKFHNNDRQSYLFMNTDKLKGFDDLNELFFEVLAVPEKDRSNDLKEKYKNIPYLNSSLFEITNYENDYITIGNLKDRLELPLYKYTVLKDNHGKPLTGSLSTLNYLFHFLNSYDFSSDVNKTVQSDNRDIINAAVLGLIFEKINGYRDGSYFTPGYITEYMCRETIRRAIIEKFNDRGWQCRDFTDLYNSITPLNIEEANEIVDSIRICDPAVGSGHFLVSALNEIIAIKSELGILVDDTGKILRNCKIKVENDELAIFYDNEFFHYIPNDSDSQRVQETIFKEKQKIIENCLFGVDINSKSVQITRLRLWIELLKNAYYKAPDYKELETLPNIDINIKCGDSLISRFNLKDDTQNLTPADRARFRIIINEYKEKVKLYKWASDKITRHKILDDIAKLKVKFSEISDPQDPDFKKLREKKDLLHNLSSQNNIHFDESYAKAWRENLDKIANEVKELEKIYDEKQNTIYQNAFEWRFEFPEVLNDDGDYVGFDAVIGNPPYIQLQKAYNDTMKYADFYKTMRYETFDRTGDIYCLFYEKGIQIAKDNGLLCYISSNKWMRAGYGEKLRNFFLKYNPLLLLDLGPGIFESATVDTCIMLLQKNDMSKAKQYSLQAVTITKEKNQPLDIAHQVKEKSVTLSKLTKDAWFIGSDAEQKLKEKIERLGKPLKDWDVNIYYGIKTGLNEAFIIDDTKRQEILNNCKDDDERRRTEAIIKPILRGRDIKRYYYEWAGLWVIIAKFGFYKESHLYPSIIQHLTRYEEQLKNRGQCKYNRQNKVNINNKDYPGQHHWLELDNNPKENYLKEFEKEKVVWGNISYNSQFSFVEPDIFINAPANIIVSDKVSIKFLCGIMNSKIFDMEFKRIGIFLGHAYEWKKQYVENVKIPPITPTNESTVRQIESLVDKILAAKKENHAADTSEWEKEIDSLVYKLYDLTEEEIAIVERRQE
jgi:type II restriction/modification system DNA methylase subunit YeeA